MYDLLLDLLNKERSTKKATTEQKEMIDKLEELKGFILFKEEIIKKKKTKGAIKKAKTKKHKEKKLLQHKKVL